MPVWPRSPPYVGLVFTCHMFDRQVLRERRDAVPAVRRWAGEGETVSRERGGRRECASQSKKGNESLYLCLSRCVICSRLSKHLQSAGSLGMQRQGRGGRASAVGNLCSAQPLPAPSPSGRVSTYPVPEICGADSDKSRQRAWCVRAQTRTLISTRAHVPSSVRASEPAASLSL